jgi:Protein of unknown function (DUF3592)
MRTSSRLFAAGLAIAAAALALTMYELKVRRDFSAKTATTIGTVLRKGAMLRTSRRSQSQSFCWVEYEFAAPDGKARLQGWGMWSDACGLKQGGPVPVEYVVANPAVNRPPGGGPPIPSFLLWFAAGVVIVIAFIRRQSDIDVDGANEPL